MARPWQALPGGEWHMDEDERVMMFHPIDINQLKIKSTYDLRNANDRAGMALARLDARVSDHYYWPIPAFITLVESTASSQMEGVEASMADLVMYRAGAKVEAEGALETSGHLDSLIHFRESESMDQEAILGAHQRLLSEQQIAGKWRYETVWIDGAYPEGARYVAPPSREVIGYIEKLLKFLNGKNLTPLWRQILGHAYFEMIHPFGDGNGRVGRSLFLDGLVRSGLMDDTTLIFSLTLKNRQDEYYDGLNALSQGGSWEDWLMFMLDVIAEAAEYSLNLVVYLNDQFKLMWMECKNDNEWALLNLIFEMPVVFSPVVVKALNVSFPTANRLLRLFESRGWLSKLDASKRAPAYVLAVAGKSLEAVNLLHLTKAKPNSKSIQRDPVFPSLQ